MSGRGEPIWHPISMLSTIAMLIDEGLSDGREHYAQLLEARPKPHVLDDATVARGRARQQRGPWFCDIYDEQLLRWRATGLTDAQQREVVRLHTASRELRVVLEQILALADELATGTVERQLSKSDIELGLEHLLGARP